MKDRLVHLQNDFAQYRKDWAKKLYDIREMLLTNAVMVSQVPAPTFHEAARASLILDRFHEMGNVDACLDDEKNVIAVMKANKDIEQPKDKLLIFAHIDNQFDASVDQNISITETQIKGAGISQDNLAIATLMTLPDIIKHLGLKLDRDIVLLATTQSHGRGDYIGIRHFVEKYGSTIGNAIELSGVKIGNLKYFTFSRIRCDIDVELELAGQQVSLYDSSAIVVLNEIISKIYEIPIPNKPKSHINIGMISGGERYSARSIHSSLKMELISESDVATENIMNAIETICSDVSVKHGATVQTDFFGRHHTAGLNAAHPLVKTAISIIRNTSHNPIMQYSNSEIAVPLSQKIPSINIGLTTGSKSVLAKNYVDLKPLHTGLMQLLELIYAIQRGYCDE